MSKPIKSKNGLSVTLTLSESSYERLKALANARHLDEGTIVEGLIEERFIDDESATTHEKKVALEVDQDEVHARFAEFRAKIAAIRQVPPLAPWATSREWIYGDRG